MARQRQAPIGHEGVAPGAGEVRGPPGAHPPHARLSSPQGYEGRGEYRPLLDGSARPAPWAAGPARAPGRRRPSRPGSKRWPAPHGRSRPGKAAARRRRPRPGPGRARPRAERSPARERPADTEKQGRQRRAAHPQGTLGGREHRVAGAQEQDHGRRRERIRGDQQSGEPPSAPGGHQQVAAGGVGGARRTARARAIRQPRSRARAAGGTRRSSARGSCWRRRWTRRAPARCPPRPTGPDQSSHPEGAVRRLTRESWLLTRDLSGLGLADVWRRARRRPGCHQDVPVPPRAPRPGQADPVCHAPAAAAAQQPDG